MISKPHRRNRVIAPGENALRSSVVFSIALVIGAAFYMIEHDFHFSISQADYNTAHSAITVIASGSAVRPIGYLLLGAIGLYLLTKKKRPDFQFNISVSLMMLGYCFWIVLSYFWADNELMALKRIVSFLLLIVFSYGCMKTINGREFLTIVFWISIGYIIIGIFSEIYIGTFRPFSLDYRFSGTLHPQGQGFNCALLFLMVFVLFDLSSGRGRSILRWLGIAALVLLIMVRARGPVAALVAAMMAYYLLTRSPSRNARAVFLVFLVGSVFLLFFGGEGVLQIVFLGRMDQIESLTGRIPLWVECWEYVEDRPLTGFGFNSFWTEERSWAFSDLQDWVVNSSHSIYLETILNIGVTGLVLLLLVLWAGLRNGLRLFRKRRELEIAAFISILIMISVDGVLSTLALGSGFVTFLMFTIVFYLGFSKTSDVGLPVQQEKLAN